ncbi:P-loop containing nucleoside triphosphate hydrolase protein [Pelagophyceae sp. CCMP2097]|nr:P-loop containing nucleoside triphosphate hydrolase protein [Pelagophyceae sp. CCMP2097]|mmetsp:Transcript_2878/g.8542  ORF Transcript_2878/g.8542 Transcript_2878/m.8542 type:complete len:1006 (-) Transcript_2878:77-3094(-)
MIYDEFGNLVGGDEDEDDEEDRYEDDGMDEGPDDGGDAMMVEGENEDRQIVLHEDKTYYPSAASVYPGATTVVLDEDAQPLEEPILKAGFLKKFSTLDESVAPTRYKHEFMLSLMEQPGLQRNVAILGAMHSGKTALCDLLTEAALDVKWNPSKEVRFTDTRKDEQDRQMSVKSCPVSLVLPDTRGKSFLLNLVDCPGHVNFSDETSAALRAVDACVLVVDAVEGCMMQTERLIKHAINERVPITLVINKIDRLILELKMPAKDAYLKLAHTLDDVNACIAAEWTTSAARLDLGDAKAPVLDPVQGNVLFASSQHSWCFTLESFARMYCDDAEAKAARDIAEKDGEKPSSEGQYRKTFTSEDFAKRLWGNVYFDKTTRKFSRKGDGERTFVEFVLEPLYKIYSHVLGEEPGELKAVLLDVGVKLKMDDLTLDPKPLLKVVMKTFLRGTCAAAFTDVVSKFGPSPLAGAALKVERCYAGDVTSPRAQAMVKCDADGPLMLHVVKLYSTPDGLSFLAYGRVYSGRVRAGQKVEVLGEAFSSEDTEDARTTTVTGVSVCVARHRIPVASAGPGCCVLLEGVDLAVRKTATLTEPRRGDDVAIFRPLRFDNAAVIKLAVEPLNPSELPKMTEGLRRISKSYPLASTRVEESGEHVVVGTGELYMDCIMHDLREMYSNVEIKVADPVVAFCETVVETSSLKCFSETPNKRNKLTMIAEPLDAGIARAVERGAVDPAWPAKQRAQFFRDEYDWDLLAARSIWAFGPDPLSAHLSANSACSNVLLDDTLPSEVDKRLLAHAKASIVQGFQWGCREGPLCDEPIRNVKFKILDATISDQPLHRGGGQLIPTARRVCYSAFLMAAPRLMEPILDVEIQCPADCVQAVYPVLARRRGHVVRDEPKPGAPFYTVRAFLPAIDSFGFETDLRAFTQGQAMCSSVFDHWAVCPGDPLDRSIILHPLEPSPVPHLAREFMVKTRRRKGLSEDVSIAKFFDDPMLASIALHEEQQETAGR